MPTGDGHLDGVRLVIDLEAPVYAPPVAEFVQAMRRLEDPPPSQLTLERLGSPDPPYLHCLRTASHGWWVTRRGEAVDDVVQAGPCDAPSVLVYVLEWAKGSTESSHDLRFRPAGNGRMPPTTWAPAKWVHSPWPASEVDAYYEFNGDGTVLREAKFRDDRTVPYSAASLADWIETQRGLFQPTTPASHRNELRFGQLPEGTEDSWGDYPRTEITRDEFEEVWRRARTWLTRQLREDTRW